MKNKSFKLKFHARSYFYEVSQNYVAFFIYNKEDDVYEVINQDRYDHYDAQFDLDMVLIDFTC